MDATLGLNPTAIHLYLFELSSNSTFCPDTEYLRRYPHSRDELQFAGLLQQLLVVPQPTLSKSKD